MFKKFLPISLKLSVKRFLTWRVKSNLAVKMSVGFTHFPYNLRTNPMVKRWNYLAHIWCKECDFFVAVCFTLSFSLSLSSWSSRPFHSRLTFGLPPSSSFLFFSFLSLGFLSKMISSSPSSAMAWFEADNRPRSRSPRSRPALFLQFLL